MQANLLHICGNLSIAKAWDERDRGPLSFPCPSCWLSVCVCRRSQSQAMEMTPCDGIITRYNICP